MRGDFPRTIWTYWHQGWEHAPELVQRCRRSWEYHNRGWTIRALDAETLPAYVDLSDFSPSPDRDSVFQSRDEPERRGRVGGWGSDIEVVVREGMMGCGGRRGQAEGVGGQSRCLVFLSIDW